MEACLVYDPDLSRYDLGEDHPLRPERFTLTIDLMEAYGLVPRGTSSGVPAPDADAPLRVIEPRSATEDELLLVHAREYVDLVRGASEHPFRFIWPRAGLGSLDTPAFRGMHEASALVAGAAIVATDAVMSGACERTLSVAGGLHHAHRDHAAGFCVYNDCAVAIAHALDGDPGLRAVYIDIDAHHGDGVQEAFWDEPRVLTISVHETGVALYPGTGFARERGGPSAPGTSANVALPPGATDACYRLAFDDAVAPLTRRFGPDLIFAQCGADAHHADPITSLGLTLAGHRWLAHSIVALADAACGGRLVAFGGGGYGWEHVVPRAWTVLAAELAGVELAAELPQEWRDRARAVSGIEPPRRLLDDPFEVDPAHEERLLAGTRRSIDELMAGA